MLVRQRITDMHALHRSTYMSERKVYYNKVFQAIIDPDNYMSIILDGMAQNHTVLSYIANMKTFPNPLKMHLQGVLEHGQSFTMYRTFQNLTNDTNLNVHCLLLQLEARIKRYGRLPPTLYIQIDGGSENANKCILAVCEFIVAKKLTSRIHLTRLPVDYTHEDIDARFGKLWTYIRSILTYFAFQTIKHCLNPILIRSLKVLQRKRIHNYLGSSKRYLDRRTFH
jgi:hypothetical protein